MNIAVEYFLRNNRAEKLLTLPCSLFLENIKKNKMVVVLLPYYGTNNVIVRQFNLQNISIQEPLLPYKEFIIALNEVFSHKDVIIPGYRLAEFRVQFFNSEVKQVNDLPMSAIQERQYHEYLTLFFNPKVMQAERKNWLWKRFNVRCIGNAKDTMQDGQYNDFPLEMQISYIRVHHPSLYRIWEFWNKNLVFDNEIASELIFQAFCNKKEIKHRLVDWSILDNYATF